MTSSIINKSPTFSVIIPVKAVNNYLREETIPKILEQSCADFEVIILPDRKTSQKFPKTRVIPTYPKTGPAQKRDLGVQRSRGKILAFLDDDAYPSENWLKVALSYFLKSDSQIAAVCGPGVTPPHDNLWQKASGWIWSTWLGAGGAGIYRCVPMKKREVDDFPTFNLLIRKDDFLKVGGFDSHFWPGEDTKLCLDLVHKLGKKIIYDPKILVYHHRRSLFEPHLRQIGNYGLHRGYFARVLPRTSARKGYLTPVVFTLGLFLGFLLTSFHPLFSFIYLGVISIYLLLLIKEGIYIYKQEKNLKLSFLVMIGIFLTHVWYGLRFVQGYFSRNLKQ